MKVIYKNMALVGSFNNIMFLKVANIQGKMCVVAGLRNGRMLPLTDAVSEDECENPLRELNHRCGDKLLNGFNMGPKDKFALRKYCIRKMELVSTETPGFVLVSVVVDSHKYNKPVRLSILPVNRRLVEMQKQVENERLAVHGFSEDTNQS